MMKCHLCGRKVNSFKKIDTAELFECKKCQLITIVDKHNHQKKLKELYNLKNYLIEAKRLRRVTSKHVTIVIRLDVKLKKKKNSFLRPLKILDVGGGYGLFDSLLFDGLLVDSFLVDSLLVERFVTNNDSKIDSKTNNDFLGQNFILRKSSGNKIAKVNRMRKNISKVIELEIVEPSQKPYFLKKIPHKLYKTTFENFLRKNRKKYNLVIMMDVLEHFRNPRENLKKALRLLTKDGHLVMQTPNYQSLMAKICKKWSWWMPEDHKYIFSVKSLKKILKKDYEIEYLRTYEDFYSFKKNFDGNFTEIKSSFVRKTIKVIIYSLFFPLYLLFRPILWRLGYGGLIFLVAKKRYNNN